MFLDTNKLTDQQSDRLLMLTSRLLYDGSGNQKAILIGISGSDEFERILEIGKLSHPHARPYYISNSELGDVFVSLQNAQLFEQTRRQLRDLETISNANQTLSSAPLETTSVAEIIAHIFIEIFGVDSTASISLLDSEIHNYMNTYVSLRKIGENTIVDEKLEQWDFKLDEYPATAKVMKKLSTPYMRVGPRSSAPGAGS